MKKSKKVKRKDKVAEDSEGNIPPPPPPEYEIPPPPPPPPLPPEFKMPTKSMSPLPQSPDVQIYTEAPVEKQARSKRSASVVKSAATEERPVTSVKNPHGVSSTDLQQARNFLRKGKGAKPAGSITRTDLFENNDVGNRNQLPIYKAIQTVVNFMTSKTLKSMDLSGLDHLTDAFFCVLMDKAIDFTAVSKLSLKGCVHITDMGVSWMSKSFPLLEEVNLNGCRLVTEASLELLLQMPRTKVIEMKGTRVTRIPPAAYDMENVSLTSCPLVSPPRSVLDRGLAESNQMKSFDTFKVAVWSELLDLSFAKFLQGSDDTACDGVNITATCQVRSAEKTIQLHLYELTKFKTLLESLVGEDTLLILPYKVPKTEQECETTALGLCEMVCQTLVKGLRYKVQVVGIGTPEPGVQEMHDYTIATVQSHLTESQQAIKNILKSWKLSFQMIGDLDFHGQQVLALLASQVENLESKVMRSAYIPVLDKDSRDGYLVELGKVLQENTDLHDNHLLLLQAHITSPAVPPLITSQDWELLSGSTYQGHALNEALRIIASRGSILHFVNHAKKPTIKDLSLLQQTLETVFSLFHQQQDAETRDEVPLSCVGVEVIRWHSTHLASVVDASQDSHASMLEMVLWMLEESGTLLKTPCYQTRESQKPWAYVLYDELPEEPHSDVRDYWSPSLIDNMMVQVNWFYYLPVFYPHTLIARFFRSCMKICHPTLLWKKGLLVQQGGISVLCQLIYSEVAKQSVIVVGGRAPLPQKLEAGHGNYQQTYHCLWSTLTIYTTLLDHTLQSLQVYAKVDIPCRTCLPSQNIQDLMKTEDVTWVTRYLEPGLHSGEETYGCFKSCAQSVRGRPKPRKFATYELFPLQDMKFPIPRHDQNQCNALQKSRGMLYTRCLLCFNCAANGLDCPHNGLSGKSALHCGCDNEAIAVCPVCGVCSACQSFLAAVHHDLYPGLSSTTPLIVKVDGKALSPELSSKTGSIWNFKKPANFYCQYAMRPETFNYWELVLSEKLTTSTVILEVCKSDGSVLLDYHMHKSLINVYMPDGLMQNTRETTYTVNLYDVVGFRVMYDSGGSFYQNAKPGPKMAVEVSINGIVVKTLEKLDYAALKPRIFTDVAPVALMFTWTTLTNSAFWQDWRLQPFQEGMLVEVYTEKTCRLMVVTAASNTKTVELQPAALEGKSAASESMTVSRSVPMLHPVGWHAHHGRQLCVYDITSKTDAKWLPLSVPDTSQLGHYLDLFSSKGMKLAPYDCFTEVQIEGVRPLQQVNTERSFWDVFCHYPYQTTNRLHSAFTSADVLRALGDLLSQNQYAVIMPCFDEDFLKHQNNVPGALRISDTLDPLNHMLTPICNFGDTKGGGAVGKPYMPWSIWGHLVYSEMAVPSELQDNYWILLLAWHLLFSLQSQVLVPKKTAIIKMLSSEKMNKLLNRFFLHLFFDKMLSVLPHDLLSLVQACLLQDTQSHDKESYFKQLHMHMEKNISKCDMQQIGEMSGKSQFLCPAHCMNSQESLIGEDGKVADDLYPYLLFVNELQLRHVSKWPSSLYGNLRHLVHLEFGSVLQHLPLGLPACASLKTLILKSSNITQLPDDLDKVSLTQLDLSGCPLRPLPDLVSQITSLDTLAINDMMLLNLPVSTHRLRNLRVLQANGNLFSTLPPSIRKLQKLEELHITGYRGQEVSQSIRNNDPKLDEWLNEIEKEKRNLEGEASKLKAFMFSVFPRLGQQVASSDEVEESDIEGSGIPAGVFKLTSLRVLVLSHQSIRYLPSQMSRLLSLTKLDVSDNPLLISLPASLGSLAITELHLRECPLLKTPPAEVRMKGMYPTLAYLARLQSGSLTCKRTKLMLVGLGGAGKTSLTTALTKETLTSGPQGDETVPEVTDGIDISMWNAQDANTTVTFSVWDFAGQTVYYNTHQFFLSNRGVYLLLWNVRLGHEHAGLHFWLGSISVHAPKAPVFVVGTHTDEVSRSELPVDDFKRKYPMIVGFHFVSSKTGQGISELREHVIQVALSQSYMGELIPEVWLKLESAVIEKRKAQSIISYQELEELAAISGIFNKTELNQAVQFLHDLGSLQHFKSEFLKERVVINPQWIVDVMACVVSVKDSCIKDGRFHHKDIGRVWSQYPKDLHEWLLRLTEEFDLTFPLSGQDANLVPCLLSDAIPQIDWPAIEAGSKIRQNTMTYVFEYLPAGLFNRAQVRLYQFSDTSTIWKRGSLLKKNDHKALVMQTKDNELKVTVHGPRPENVLFLVHEVLEGLIAESFHGVSYDYLITCPDCLQQGLKEPAHFASSMVHKASSRKVPFLQCNKNFHVVSITDLHANMPPDNTQDYDLHLSVALEGLASLRKDLSTDIFISYCEEDVKDSKTVITPVKIRDDLAKGGFKCYFPESSQPLQQLGVALKDAKAFLALVSDSYVTDPRCYNLFNFARFTMNKPVLLAPVGTGLEWKKSKLGLLVAQEVFVNMQKVEAYPAKLEELRSRLANVSSSQDREHHRSYSPCFISYCWQNSRQARDKGTRCPEEALGFGDPREIKSFLQGKGIDCWLDVEQVGKKGLFEDIAEGLRHARVMVACISDEYAASSNCVMEFRFAARVLGLPVILAVVGTGATWRSTEVGMLSLSCKMVSFQQPSENAFNKLYELVTAELPAQAQHQPQHAQSPSKDDETTSNVSFQELYELAQRKFLRQIAHYAENAADVYPRLVVIDFKQDSCDNALEGSRPGSAQLTRRDTNRKPVPANVLPANFTPVFKILCEHEEGWHPYQSELDAMGSPVMESMAEYSPYLARILSLLQQSNHAYLTCTTTDPGAAFLKWLRELPQAVKSDFGDVYKTFRQEVIKADVERSMGQLARCHLASGKTTWLCPEHQRLTRLTILTDDILLSQQQSEVLGDESMAVMVQGEQGQQWRRQWQASWTSQQQQQQDAEPLSDDEEQHATSYTPPAANNSFDFLALALSNRPQNVQPQEEIPSQPELITEKNLQHDKPGDSTEKNITRRTSEKLHNGLSESELIPEPPSRSRTSTARQRRHSSIRERLLKSASVTTALTRQPTSIACSIL